MPQNGSATERSHENRNFQDGRDNSSVEPVDQAALLALLRLLTREPPPGHDFKTCPICQRYGITEI